MNDYIKVSYKGSIYGPIQAPAPFHVVCSHLRVSLNASPSLGSIKDPGLVIVDRNRLVPTGFYELLALPNIRFDPVEEQRSIDAKRAVTRHSIDTQTDKCLPIQQSVANYSLPLGKSEMDVVMKGMLHLISSIPPRYIVLFL